MLQDRPVTKGLQFNLRTVLVWVAILSLLIGWYTSMQRERTRLAWLSQQLSNARLQISMADSRDYEQATKGSPMATGVLSSAKVEGLNLRDAVIRGGDTAFQRTIFDSSDLTNASLIGGVSAFQYASFNNSMLRNAKLVGGAASFQLAKFEYADLSGAILTGNLQGASLRNAKCIGTKISGSFQAVNIDAAQFLSADLSAIRNEDLESCYFDSLPTYDAKTKFPNNFNPVAHGWKNIPNSPGLN